jgi:hypothetical protein
MTEDMEVAYVKCLFGLHRYNQCLLKAHRHILETNYSNELVFIEGLCQYYLQNYRAAADIFAADQAWRLWYQKSLILMEKTNIIEIRELAATNTLQILSSMQDEDGIKITLSLGVLSRGMIDVDFGYDWVDINVNSPAHSDHAKTFELVQPINAEECTFCFSPNGLTLFMKKKEKGKLWPEPFVMTEELKLENGMQKVMDLTKTVGSNGEAKWAQGFERGQLDMLGTVEERMARKAKEIE